VLLLDDTGLAGVLGVRLTGVYGSSIFSISSESGAGKTLARLRVENENVSFVQQQKAFMVTGTQ
jgi:hypothetical protein